MRQVVDSALIHDTLKQAESAGFFRTSDPGISLFSAALNAGAPMRFEPRGAYLDAGCCEADWLHLAHKAWPECLLSGVDWRAQNVTDGDGKVARRQGNALDPDIYVPESFDGIVSLSAVEHFGLGHYGSDGNKDPLDPDGDSRIIANCWRWLKPGGWLYFDVPYDPSGYRVQGTEYRIYDDRVLAERLYRTQDVYDDDFRVYVRRGAEGTLIEKPTDGEGNLPYYVALCWVKA